MAVTGASWVILPALVAGQVHLGGHLGHLGSVGVRQGRVLAADRVMERGGDARGQAVPERAAFRRLQKPCQTALGLLARLSVPGGTVADHFRLSQCTR